MNNEATKTAQFRALEALRIIKQHNSLRNDRDAYLWDVCEYGLGLRAELPKEVDYGGGFVEVE